jgi:NAD(P)-dependent dehydrogenase (short-subunit alcohol dehydrogenase family)
MSSNFAGKSVLITGGGSGIGRAVAVALARQGASIALAGRDENRLLETAAQISYEGGEVVTIPTDVSDPEQAAYLVSQTVAAYDTIDILINSAGIGLIKPLDTVTVSEVDALLDTK